MRGARHSEQQIIVCFRQEWAFFRKGDWQVSDSQPGRLYTSRAGSPYHLQLRNRSYD